MRPLPTAPREPYRDLALLWGAVAALAACLWAADALALPGAPDADAGRLAMLSGAPYERAVTVLRAIDRALDAETVALPRARVVAAVVAARESGLRPEVEACRVAGDSGRSWGLWQVHGATGERACRAGLDAQAAAGVAHLARCARLWPGSTALAMRCYGVSHAEAEARARLVAGWP